MHAPNSVLCALCWLFHRLRAPYNVNVNVGQEGSSEPRRDRVRGMSHWTPLSPCLSVSLSVCLSASVSVSVSLSVPLPLISSYQFCEYCRFAPGLSAATTRMTTTETRSNGLTSSLTRFDAEQTPTASRACKIGTQSTAMRLGTIASTAARSGRTSNTSAPKMTQLTHPK